jgi:signal peptidase II
VSRWNRELRLLAAGLAVCAVDQATKVLAVRFLLEPTGPRSVPVLGDWLRFTYVTNTGAAFGMFPNGTAILAAIAVLVIPAIFYYQRFLDRRWWPVRLVPALLLGGTLGNLIDRVRLGYVVDFIDVGVGALRWPAFNIADSAFVVGSIILVVHALWHERAGALRSEPAPPAGPADGGRSATG